MKTSTKLAKIDTKQIAAPATAQEPATQGENWTLAGQPSTAKNAVDGVGPMPGSKTVGYAALTRIGTDGATLEQIQAAVTAVGLKGAHPVKPLLRWLAKERGYTFVCTNGLVKRG